MTAARLFICPVRPSGGNATGPAHEALAAPSPAGIGVAQKFE